MADEQGVNLDSETVDPAAPDVPAITRYIPPTIDTPDSMTRKWISYLLLGLLTAVVVVAFVELIDINATGVPMISNQIAAVQAIAADTNADADRLMRLMNVVFGPVVTLFSSVVGFYFGARTARDAGAA